MEQNSLPRTAMLGIAFIQGLLLLALYRSSVDEFWPSGSPVWAFPIWTLALAVPPLLLLSLERSNVRTLLPYVAAFAALLALLGFYTGWQAEPVDEFPVSSLSALFAMTIGIGCFKALMYLQQRANGQPLHYELLFTYSWRNFLVGAFSALFTLVFWLILNLWGQLFKVIGIAFFADLFAEDWFLIPVSTMVFGLGISVFRDLTRVIDNVTKLLHWLIKLLLPLLLFVAVVFLSALPFTGLTPLWDTGRGTALLLTLLALTLFFTNAVYQDGREANPYPTLLHRAIYASFCVMPVVAALACYGLLLRIQQYGWTVERCWAAAVWLLLTLFSLGYFIGILRRRDAWPCELAAVNTGMGLVVLAIMILANSPLLDFRKISLDSQLARVDSGEIPLEEFDFWYVKQHLARPGYLAVEAIRADLGDEDRELLALIDAPYRGAAALPKDIDRFWEKLRYRPEPFDVPLDLQPLLETHGYLAKAHEPILIREDLDGDGREEYLLLLLGEYGLSTVLFYHRAAEGWQVGDLHYRAPETPEAVRQSLLEGGIRLREPRFKNLSIGDLTLQPIARK